MTKNEKNKNLQGFVFKKIPMDEAITLVRAGSGIYAELKESLLKEIQASTGEAVSFSMNGTNLDEKAVVAVLSALRKFLKDENIGWRLSHNAKHALFVCVPEREEKMPKKGRPKNYSAPTISPRMHRIISTASDIFGTSQEKILSTGSKGSGSADIRRIVVVTARSLHIRGNEVGAAFGTNKKFVYNIMGSYVFRYKKQVALLTKALKKEGL